MKDILYIAYGIFIAIPVTVFLIPLFPIFMLIDSISKKYRWKITLKIHDIEEEQFDRCYRKNLENDIFIDYPPSYPDAPLTTMSILYYFITAPLKSYIAEIVEDEDEDFNAE